jgi:hypothetical protein
MLHNQRTTIFSTKLLTTQGYCRNQEHFSAMLGDCSSSLLTPKVVGDSFPNPSKGAEPFISERLAPLHLNSGEKMNSNGFDD